MCEDLIPFFTYNDIYLKQIYRVDLTVALPKLRQMGQSVSNWEIRQRLKKRLDNIEVCTKIYYIVSYVLLKRNRLHISN